MYAEFGEPQFLRERSQGKRTDTLVRDRYSMTE